jgi:putative DNA methylase
VTYKKKLIEVALPLAAINAESARDKGIRNHPQALHRWWARRPLAAARAVLWASLVDDPSAHLDRFPSEHDQQVERKRLFDILEKLVLWESSNDARVIAEARTEIERSCVGELPRILDPFGGGGAIPLEALRLGLPTWTGDLNPVAVVIQRAMLEIPSRFAGLQPVHPDVAGSQVIWEGASGLAADIERYGRWMQDEAKARVGPCYPDATGPDGRRMTPVAWIWARTVKSPDPSWGEHVPLVRSWVLSNKKGKPIVWVEPVVDSAGRSVSYHVRQGGTPQPGTIARQGGVCIATGAPIPVKYIRDEAKADRMSSVMLAVVAEGHRTRLFLDPVEADVSAADAVPEPAWIPSGAMSSNTRHMSPPGFGLDEWSKLFTRRQLLTLSVLVELLADVEDRIVRDASLVRSSDDRALRDGGDGVRAYAEAVVTYIGLALSKGLDFNCNLAGWDSTNVKIRNVFARQALPMTWDFAEANLLGEAVGSFASMISSTTAALLALPVGVTGATAQRDARARIAEIGECVVSTDPPYYDNVPYADISDFFYVWLRKTLGHVWPDEFATLLTPKIEELVADPVRAGSKARAQVHFEQGMREVFEQAAAFADPRYPATIFYAFKATESTGDGVISTGWETFLGGLLEAGFSIQATWPVRTEKPGRTREIGSAALASSIVLACRPREVAAPMATRGEFVAALRSELEPAVRLLQVENIAPVDLAQSAIGPGVAIFSRYAKVVEADGSGMTVRTALGLINEVLAEVLSGEESEFDSDTRFALTWFEQYGHNPGPFGDADLLARAKDTTVSGVAQAGVVVSRDGKVRLVERHELPAAWDPATDTRLTIWETTQHLIRALESSETDSAALLTRMGEGLGERARQLAYLLYGVCDRKKWADEAGAYNMLVTAWPEISRLAAAGPAPEAPEQLF